jgi:cytochrome c
LWRLIFLPLEFQRRTLMRVALLIVPLLLFSSIPTPLRAETAEQLFHSTALGSNGKSCATCHPQGKGLEKIADYDDATLREIINFCIRDALKGELLPEKSAELRALGSYLRRFQESD